MRAEMERLLHQTMRSMGVTESDAHMIIEWIADEDDAERTRHAAELAEARRTWLLRALGMGAIGATLGSAIGWIAHAWTG